MNINRIVEEVCLHISIKLGVDDIRKDTRLIEIIDGRRIAYYILREKYNLSYAAIGKFFNKDHATVLYNLKAVKDLLEYDLMFKEKFNACVADFDRQKDGINVIAVLKDFKESMENIDIEANSINKDSEVYELLKKITKFNNSVLNFVNTKEKYQQQWEKIIQD